jgi:hypothetical protein
MRGLRADFLPLIHDFAAASDYVRILLITSPT